MGKGEATRERILEIAEAAVLAKGFGATSIEEVIAEAGLTKSGFFYHFKDKNALAREMLRRYVATNDRLFDEIFARADKAVAIEGADDDGRGAVPVGRKVAPFIVEVAVIEIRPVTKDRDPEARHIIQDGFDLRPGEAADVDGHADT